MDQRQLDFEKLLRGYCPNIYFQPPPGIKLKYPCVIYNWVGGTKEAANNKGYMYTRQWNVLYITPDVKASTPMRMLQDIATSEFNRTYYTNGLSHTVLNIYY